MCIRESSQRAHSVSSIEVRSKVESVLLRNARSACEKHDDQATGDAKDERRLLLQLHSTLGIQHLSSHSHDSILRSVHLNSSAIHSHSCFHAALTDQTSADSPIEAALVWSLPLGLHPSSLTHSLPLSVTQ